MTIRIHLIRHGDVHNPKGILYGRMPNFRLSAKGREQATSARDALKNKPLSAIFASPQPRAQETANIIVNAHPEITLQTSELIDEVLTPREGESLNELAKDNFDLYTGNQPPYELQNDVFARTQQFITQARLDYNGQEIAAITHGDIVAFMFLFAKGATPDMRQKGQMQTLGLPEEYPATASISTLTYSTDDPHEVPEYSYLRPYDL